MKILPRFKIQYPMKNQDKDNYSLSPNNTLFVVYSKRQKKSPLLKRGPRFLTVYINNSTGPAHN